MFTFEKRRQKTIDMLSKEKVLYKLTNKLKDRITLKYFFYKKPYLNERENCNDSSSDEEKH